MLQIVPMIPTLPIIDNMYTLVFLTDKGWQQNSVQLAMNPVLVQFVYEKQSWGTKFSQTSGIIFGKDIFKATAG